MAGKLHILVMFLEVSGHIGQLHAKRGNITLKTAWEGCIMVVEDTLKTEVVAITGWTVMPDVVTSCCLH